jgi:hypothetical protein
VESGGSTVWGLDVVRPETNLFFYGTANPACGNPDLRPGDNKWSSTIFRARCRHRRRRWAYQVTRHDSWDYDEIMENLLVDMDYGGRSRKLIVHPGRTGFVYVLDRETGELLSADTYEPTNWASGYDLKTGKALEDPAKQTHFGTVTQGICPSSTGAKDVIPSAFSPRTGLLYIPAHNTCMDYEGIEANYIAGTPYLGADVKMYPGPVGIKANSSPGTSPTTARRGGQGRQVPVYSGVLATGGDVVFYGTMDGWFKAVDARTGTELWKFHVASGLWPIRSPISGPTASSTSRSTRGSADGWARSRFRRSPRRSLRRARCGRRHEGHQEVHGARKHGVCLRSVGVSARLSTVGGLPLAPSAQAPLRVCADPEQHAVLERPRRRVREQDRDARRARAGPSTDTSGSATARLSSQLAQCRTLRRRDRRCPQQYGLLQPTKSYYPISPTVRLPPRSALAHRFVRCAFAQIADDSGIPDGTEATTTTIPCRRGACLAALVQNIRGFTIYGENSRPDPQREIVDDRG